MGEGVLTCRSGANVVATGALLDVQPQHQCLGVQMGTSSTDYVLLVMSENRRKATPYSPAS